ncbi:hypothetical protein ABVT39_024737 [Epinephelus coioides]
MYRFAKAAVNITGQAARQVRHGSTAAPNFHSKYGTGLMIGGATFCVGADSDWHHLESVTSWEGHTQTLERGRGVKSCDDCIPPNKPSGCTDDEQQ